MHRARVSYSIENHAIERRCSAEFAALSCTTSVRLGVLPHRRSSGQSRPRSFRSDGGQHPTPLRDPAGTETQPKLPLEGFHRLPPRGTGRYRFLHPDILPPSGCFRWFVTPPTRVPGSWIGPVCNLNCKYCFYPEKEELYRDTAEKTGWDLSCEYLPHRRVLSP